MACDKALLVHAYIDGELDPAAVLDIEAHIGACGDCRELLTSMTELRDALRAVPQRAPVPPGLASRIGKALDRVDAEAGEKSGWLVRLGHFAVRYRQWLGGTVTGAAVAAGIAVALLLSAPSEDDDRVASELADAHLRSLMPDHLVDLSSSDQKTIAPWFKSQVDAAPPVIDLHAQGFDLKGGRTDVIDGKRVAVVVYRQGSHVVNLFVWADYELDHPSTAMRAGYNLLMWPQRHLAFCAVSDIGVAQLKTLARAVNAGMASAND